MEGGVADREPDPTDVLGVIERIRAQARTENVLVSQHARQEMAEEAITLDDVLQAAVRPSMLENYPDHRRGACCLIGGSTVAGRPLHIVGSTMRPQLILITITVYEPKPPKWITPTQRRPTHDGVQH